MADSLQLEGATDNLLLEDGAGNLLLQTAGFVTASVSTTFTLDITTSGARGRHLSLSPLNELALTLDPENDGFLSLITLDAIGPATICSETTICGDNTLVNDGPVTSAVTDGSVTTSAASTGSITLVPAD